MPGLRKTLFVTICSNNKKKGGSAGYDEKRSILSCVSGPMRRELLAGRARVLGLIKRGGKDRDGKRISEKPHNRELVKGPDFGGSDTGARYLPAAERYAGSFFAQFGPDVGLLYSGSASVVIMSGLYGLALADEPVQDNSCHLNDHPTIREVWTARDLMTEAILSLISERKIERVLDFTSLHSYRYVLDWRRIRARLPKGVLHLFGEKSTGDSLLTPLGALARRLLGDRTERELLDLKSGQFLQTETERIYLHSGEGAPGKGLPHGLLDELSLFDTCDEVARMARDVRRLLRKVDPEFDDRGVPTRIDALARERRIPRDVALAMKDIVKWRDQVERQYSFTALQIPIDWLRERHKAVAKWRRS
jgi:hypothetical protein